MSRTFRMKCSGCGHWNRVAVNNIFIEQYSPEPKVKVFIPMEKDRSQGNHKTQEEK